MFFEVLVNSIQHIFCHVVAVFSRQFHAFFQRFHDFVVVTDNGINHFFGCFFFVCFFNNRQLKLLSHCSDRFSAQCQQALSDFIHMKGCFVIQFFKFHMQSKERSEEHTSELQSRENLVCRLLLEKKKPKTSQNQCR